MLPLLWSLLGLHSCCPLPVPMLLPIRICLSLFAFAYAHAMGRAHAPRACVQAAGPSVEGPGGSSTEGPGWPQRAQHMGGGHVPGLWHGHKQMRTGIPVGIGE